MRVLFWVPSWFSDGNPVFFINTLRKHLIPQANSLKSKGCDITFVLPEIMKAEKGRLSQGINIHLFSFIDQVEVFGGFADKSLDYYGEVNCEKLMTTVEKMRDRMPKGGFDFIFVWETPVSFLQALYPEAVVVNQMPGAFSRPPYPHTVTFDIFGLYKEGAIFKYAQDIKNGNFQLKGSIRDDFSSKVKESLISMRIFDLKSTLQNKFEKVNLLPLQVTSHYSFLKDTGYKSQSEFLFDVLGRIPKEEAVIITQYVNGVASDRVLNSDLVDIIKKRWNNIYFDEGFDNVSGVSQYLLPEVDKVITCSSSIGLQAMVWGHELVVPKNTYLKPYENNNKYKISKGEGFYGNVLDFLLKKNQPLFSQVVNNPDFVISYLESISYNKKKGVDGIDVLPDFSDIDEDYNEKLMSSFMIDRAMKSVNMVSKKISAKNEDISKFKRAVNKDNIKAISFDLFDTLIYRPTETPADVYKFIEAKLIKLGIDFSEGFAKIRLDAEVSARAESDSGEILLDDIYNYIKVNYHVADDVIKIMKDLEIEAEISFVKKKAYGGDYFRVAKESKKPIYLLSDMYLPESVIRGMLDKTGFSGFKEIIVSSSYGVRKKEGGLFDVLINKASLSPENILHVGDNKVADCDRAQEKGLSSFRILRSIDRMRADGLWKSIFSPKSGAGELSRSAIAGLISHRLFEYPLNKDFNESLFQDDPFNIGYAALGPMIAGFSLWLKENAKRDGVKTLYFLSREGWILKKVYDIFSENEVNSVKSKYLYCSRRCVRVASLTSVNDIAAYAMQPYSPGVTLYNLVKSRFGLDLNTLSDVVDFGAWGYSGGEDLLDASAACKSKFVKFCLGISSEILKKSEFEREAYFAYLKNFNFATGGKIAVVDVGWKANMQNSLSKLLSRNINGYYYGTLQGAEVCLLEGNPVSAYSGNFVTSDNPGVVFKNRHLMEYLTCHVESTLLYFEMEGASPVPVFKVEENSAERRVFIEKVHAGIVAFSMDLKRNFGEYIDSIKIDPYLAEKVFASFVTSPSIRDAQLMQGHFFEDSVGGVEKKYLVNLKDVSNSVWKNGVNVLLKNNDKKDFICSDVEKINKNEKKNPIQNIERIFVKVFSSERKFAKYKNSPKQFFSDSKNPVLKAWYKWKYSND